MRKVDVKKVLFTPEWMEKEFHPLPGLFGERDLKKIRIAFLRMLIAENRYQGPSLAIVIDKSTGKTYRGNGQHTDYVMSHLEGAKFPVDPVTGEPLLATLDVWEIETMDEAHDLFDIFDNPMCSRNNADYMTMVKSAYPELRQLPSSFLIHATNAIDAYFAKQPKGSHIKPRYRGDDLLCDDTNRAFVVWLSRFLDSENANFIGRTLAMAVAFEGWLSQDLKEKATLYWTYVFENNHPDPDDESHLLATELIKAALRARRGEDLSKIARRSFKRWLRDQDDDSPPSSPSTSDLFAAPEAP